MMRLCAALLALCAAPAFAQEEQCRQALALGLDVSASVDAREYRLQLEGLATALEAEPVRAALLAMASAPVHLLVFEWSGTDDQHVLADWTAIRSAADIAVLQETLRQVRRRETSPGTALGEALRAGLAQLDRRAGCWRRTLDISGDGKANMGADPRSMRNRLEAAGITVNGLVIGADAPGFGDLRQAEIGELSSYYQANVITGADSFVQTALGYEEYADAMARKLERELEGLIFSRLAPGTHP